MHDAHTSLPLFDAHAHMYADAFATDLGDVLAHAAARGVQAVLTVSETVDEAQRILDLAARYPLLRPCAGLYPTILDRDAAAAMLAFIRQHADQLVAIGEVGREQGVRLVNAVTNFLHASEIGFEQLFFDWYGGHASAERAAASPEKHLYRGVEFDELRSALEVLDPLRSEALRGSYFAEERPCTLLIDEIETLWQQIAERDDWSAFEAKLAEIEGMRCALLLSQDA